MAELDWLWLLPSKQQGETRLGSHAGYESDAPFSDGTVALDLDRRWELLKFVIHAGQAVKSLAEVDFGAAPSGGLNSA